MDTIMYYELKDNIFYYGANAWEGATQLTFNDSSYTLPIQADGALQILPHDTSIVEWYPNHLPIFKGNSAGGFPSLATRNTDWSHIRLHNYIKDIYHHTTYTDYRPAWTLYNSVNFNRSKQWLNSEFIIGNPNQGRITRSLLGFCSGDINVSFPGLLTAKGLFNGGSSNLVVTSINLDIPIAKDLDATMNHNHQDVTFTVNAPLVENIKGLDGFDVAFTNDILIHPANALAGVNSIFGIHKIRFIEDDGDYSYTFNNYKGTYDNIVLDYKNIVNADHMFSGATSLPSDLDFNFPNLTNPYNMFAGCISIKGSVYLNAPKAIGLGYVFNGCTNITSVKLNTPKVTGADGAFYGCTKLKTIYSSNLSKLTSGNDMFYNCVSLVGGNGTTFNSSNTSYIYAKVDKEGTPGYFTYTKSDNYYNVNVVNSEYALLSYPGANFAPGEEVEITANLPSYLAVDYWLQYNSGDKSWHNIGSKYSIKGTINSDMDIILVPKYVGEGVNFTVSLTSVPSNSCTLTGAGTYTVGDNVIITARPNEGYIFKQWEELINETWIILSESKVYTLEAIGRDRTIRAVCVEDSPEVGVTLTLTNDGNGTTFGSGRYLKGGKAEAAASANAGYKFVKWINESGETISASKVYTFIINEDTTLQAIFAKDPYYNGGSSGTGGGGGNFDDTSDMVGGSGDEYSNVFTYNGGLFTAFVLSNDDVTNFKNYMYNTDLIKGMQSIIDQIGTLGGQVSDYILNFVKLPITIPVTKRKDVQIGFYHTSLNFAYADKIGYQKGMGSLKVEPYWGNALDYKSKIQIYLPYIGYEYLDTAEVMGKTIGIKYNISLIDGSCVALIYVDDNLKYQFNGNCATNLPISQVNMTEVTQKALSLGASVITAGATSEASLNALTAGNATANIGTPEAQQFASSQINKGNQLANKTGDSIQNAMSNVGGNVRRCSNLSGNLGMLSSQTPYLIISRPRLCMPDNYGHYHGYPSNITRKLGDLSGYTVVSNIHLDGLDATSSEIEELESILKSGIIIK